MAIPEEMTCNLRHPMGLCHPVPCTRILFHTNVNPELTRIEAKKMANLLAICDIHLCLILGFPNQKILIWLFPENSPIPFCFCVRRFSAYTYPLHTHVPLTHTRTPYTHTYPLHTHLAREFALRYTYFQEIYVFLHKGSLYFNSSFVHMCRD